MEVHAVNDVALAVGFDEGTGLDLVYRRGGGGGEEAASPPSERSVARGLGPGSDFGCVAASAICPLVSGFRLPASGF
ncbi:hypothetical protein Ga0100231_007570 [Opitutaceae bacterium TAV4]|nr:hypothetical protein Ga0100231_007570 [Opitutaceae bacterium TAV4]